MPRVRYANIAAKITGVIAVFWVLGIVSGAYVLYSLGNEAAWILLPLAFSFAFIVDFLALRFVLPKACKDYDLYVSKNNHPVTPHGAALLGLAWGLMWRVIVVSIPLNFLRNLVGETESAIFLDFVISLAGLFFSSLWLLKHQLGSTTIEKIKRSAGTVYDHNTQEIVVENADAIKTAKDAIKTILTTTAILSYFAIGFLQLAAIISFFHDYWGWWYLPSFLVAMFVAYIPVVGAISGMYAAMEVWEWAWYWSALLFFFPIVLGALVMGVAGFVGMITSKFRR